MSRPSRKNIKAGIIRRIFYDAGMGFQYEASAGIGQNRGESVYTYVVPCSSLAILHTCSPLFFLSHTDRPSLWWLNFIIDKKQHVGKNSNSEFLSPSVGLVLCRWYSAHSLDSGRDCSPLRTHHNKERKGQCGVPCCVLVSAGISSTLLTADIFDSHEVYLEATPSLVKDTCITQRTKSWWCDKKPRRGHGSGDRRPRMKTGNNAFQKSSQATPCSCLN